MVNKRRDGNGAKTGGKGRRAFLKKVVWVAAGVALLGAAPVEVGAGAAFASGSGAGPGGVPRFSEVERIPVGLPGLTGLAVAPPDRILVTGQRALWILDGGRVSAKIPLSETPRCVAVGAQGTIYLGMDDYVAVHDAAGKRLARWGTLPAGAIVTAVAVGEREVYVADAGNKTVYRFSPQGRLLNRIGGPKPSNGAPGFVLPSPYFDVGVDPWGALWIANTGRYQLENYTPDGRFRSSWGESSAKPEGFCGCCNPIHFAFLSDGRCVTSEKGIPRVKVYSQTGALLQVLADPRVLGEGTTGFDLAVDKAGRVLVLDPAQGIIRVFAAPAAAKAPPR